MCNRTDLEVYRERVGPQFLTGEELDPQRTVHAESDVPRAQLAREQERARTERRVQTAGGEGDWSRRFGDESSMAIQRPLAEVLLGLIHRQRAQIRVPADATGERDR